MSVIRLDSVSKRFELHPDRPRSLQDLVLRRLHRERDPGATTLWALRDVSLSVGSGETVGLIGSNGSGKSTCLKLMTRILDPTSGSVAVRGRVSALLELGAGFHPELTGRENILLNGSVLGISRREMMARFDDIVAFAELERFIDVPVKVYSSGMYVRLAFATAISVSPEILLVDEVLAVGDQSFQDKCMERIRELKAEGVTIVLVSHDLDSVAALCDRVIWLDEGRLAMDGMADEVLTSYLAHVYAEDDPQVTETSSEDLAPTEMEDLDPPDVQVSDDVSVAEDEPVAEPEPAADVAIAASPQPERWGSGKVQILEVVIRDAAGHVTTELMTGEAAEIAIRYQVIESVAEPAFGVAIHRDDGTHISGCNTVLSGYALDELVGEGVMRYEIDHLPLLAGDYLISVAIHNVQETEAYDYMSLYVPFHVTLGKACPHQGLVHLPAHWRHEPGDATPGGGQ